MTDFEQLKRPPIKEAVLWIKTNPVSGPTTKIVDLVPDPINSKFPGHRQQITLKAEIQGAEQESLPRTSTEQSIVAELRDSEDGSRTVSIRRDGMSLSALQRVYRSWGDFVGEFREVWQSYLNFNDPKIVNRITTRFINEIAIPFGSSGAIELDQWLVNLPKSPKGLPDKLSKFSQQVSIPYDDNTRVLINLLSTGTSFDGLAHTVILDIDVAVDVDCVTKSNDFWHYFDHLHQIKNLAFFGSVSEKTLDMYR